MKFSSRVVVFLYVLFAGCMSQPYPFSANVSPPTRAQYEPSRTIFNFPDRTVLSQIALTPVETFLGHNDARAVDVDEWELSPPFPRHIGEAPVEDATALDQALTSVIEEGRQTVVVTEQMRCVARQVGLFFLAHQELPVEEQRQFMAHRCGATAQAIQTLAVHSRHHRSASNSAILPDMRRSAREMLAERLPEGRGSVGFWYGRAGQRAIVVMMVGDVLTELDGISPLGPEDRYVWIAGELTFPAERIEGLINHGDASVEHCEPSHAVAPPRFALRCPVALGDETALLQLGAAESRRVLLKNVASIMVRRAGDVALRWNRPSREAGGTVGSTEDFTSLVLEGVNSIRTQAGRAPLEFAGEQSGAARQLAPHFFAKSSTGRNSGQDDTIAMGLAAGWEVDQIIRRSWFSAAKVPNTSDANQWLAYALSSPSGRNALLNPDARVLAFGGIAAPDGGGLAAIFATYAFFDDQNERQQAQEIQRRILNARRFRGLPSNVQSSPGAAEEARRVRNQGVPPQEALDRAIQRATVEWRRPVQGMVFEFYDASQFQAPAQLMTPGSGLVAVEITHHRPIGGAWGQYVGFLLVGM